MAYLGVKVKEEHLSSLAPITRSRHVADVLSSARHTFSTGLCACSYVSPTHLSLIHDMYLLSDLALKAILGEWDPQRYDPPKTNIREWIRAIESLSDTYGIPDTQRPQCAVKFIRAGLRAELETVLKKARASFGPIHWDRFADFMIAFDRK